MLGAAPAELRFTHGPDGKPALAGGDIGFNLSKSGDGLLIAIARGATVGCDLEQMRPNVEAKAIAARWFSASEREALLKAVGTGLQGPLGVDTGDPEPLASARPVTIAGAGFG